MAQEGTNSFFLEEPVGKLMRQFTIPCVTSMLVSSLYNIVDQIFIGRGVGYLGNGATNVVYPITLITLAVAMLIGDSCAAYLSISQGKGDRERARKCVGNAITLILACGLALTVALWLGRERVLWYFGATEQNISYASAYFFYILLGTPFYMFGSAFSSVVRADGNPKLAMTATLTGCVLNLVLDPIAIFVLDWGMAGAAIATVLGQVASAVLCGVHLLRSRSLGLQMGDLVPDGGLLREMLPLGGSSCLTQASIMVNMTVMNNVLVTWGARSKFGPDIPLSVMGIVMKVFGIVIAVCVGVAAGSQPIVGYNFGARAYDRVRALFRTMMAVESAVGIGAMVVFECFPLPVIRLFGAQGALYEEYALLAFRIYLGTIWPCCIQKATSIFMQALGKPGLSMSLSLLRDFALCVPLMFLLPLWFGIYGPLFSAPIADILSFLAALGVMWYLKRLLERLSGQRAEG